MTLIMFQLFWNIYPLVNTYIDGRIIVDEEVGNDKIYHRYEKARNWNSQTIEEL